MKTEIDPRKAEHLDALRQALLSCRRATRAQLSGMTGLSTMTVGKLLAHMELRGEVRQDEMLRSASGRPSTVAGYNGEYAHFAAISVHQQAGESAFTMSVYNLFGERVKTRTMRLDVVRQDSFDAFFRETIEQGFRLRLAVFVLPGVALGDNIFACDFEGLMYAGFLPRIREAFGVEPLFENDVNAAVYGHVFEETADVCAGIYMPQRYEPGAGVVIGGRIHYGHRHFAGELGHIHDGWKRLDYRDEARVMDMIEQTLVAYACTIAPSHMVLYGDFFNPARAAVLEQRVRTRLHGQFDMRLSCDTDIDEDMQRGARRIGLGKMRELLRAQDANS